MRAGPIDRFRHRAPRSRRAALASVCLTLTSAPASAEWVADLYAGGGFTRPADVTITTEDVNLPGFQNVRVDLEEVEAEEFLALGLRLGRWFERVPDVGLAIDIFHFGPDVDRQTVSGSASADFSGEILDTPINIGGGVRGDIPLPDLGIPSTIVVSSFDLMLRRPVLRSAAFPDGRLQPYLTAGPALLFTDTRPEVTVGVKVGAGATWLLLGNVGLFGEYRFTHFSPEIETGGVLVGPVETGDLNVETELNTHYILTGVSLRF